MSDFQQIGTSGVYKLNPTPTGEAGQKLNTNFVALVAKDADHDDAIADVEANVAANTSAIAGKADASTLTAHTSSTSNPHSTTAAQVGAYSTSQADTLLAAKANATTVNAHISNTSNPHSTTAAQVGAYSTAQVDSALAGKASTSHVHSGADITSGTVADARLSSNIPLKDGANVFSADQRVDAKIGVGTAPSYPIHVRNTTANQQGPTIDMNCGSGGCEPFKIIHNDGSVVFDVIAYTPANVQLVMGGRNAFQQANGYVLFGNDGYGVHLAFIAKPGTNSILVNQSSGNVLIGASVVGDDDGANVLQVHGDANLNGTVSVGAPIDVGALGISAKLTVDDNVYVAGSINCLNVGLQDGGNMTFGDTQGTMIGTGADNKIGFFGATPIAQPSGDIATALEALGLVSSPTISGGGSGVPTGTIQMWLGAQADIPAGWLLLNGGSASRTTYADLFALWGTTFGAGDGSSTFGLPDMQNRFPFGCTPGVVELASTGGAATHAISTSELPSHNHAFSASGSAGGSYLDNVSTNTSSADTNSDGSASSFVTSLNTGQSTPSFSFSGTTDSTGDGQAMPIIPPYMAMHFIVKG